MKSNNICSDRYYLKPFLTFVREEECLGYGKKRLNVDPMMCDAIYTAATHVSVGCVLERTSEVRPDYSPRKLKQINAATVFRVISITS